MDESSLIPASEVVDILNDRYAREPVIATSGAVALRELAADLTAYMGDRWAIHTSSQADRITRELNEAAANIARCLEVVAAWKQQGHPDLGEFETVADIFDAMAEELERRGYAPSVRVEDTCAEIADMDVCFGCTVTLLTAPIEQGGELEVYFAGHDCRWGLLINEVHTVLESLGGRDAHPLQVLEIIDQELGGNWPKPLT